MKKKMHHGGMSGSDAAMARMRAEQGGDSAARESQTYTINFGVPIPLEEPGRREIAEVILGAVRGDRGVPFSPGFTTTTRACESDDDACDNEGHEESRRSVLKRKAKRAMRRAIKHATQPRRALMRWLKQD